MRLKHLISSAALIVLLIGCGGGSDESDSSATPEAASPPIALTPAAPDDDLTAQPGSITAASGTHSTFCGYGVGSSRLVGTVSTVHDGDTITVGNIAVRLDSIDAPELTQSYGGESKTKLSALVLGKPVTVAYAKKDRFGRIVGSVFTSDCSLVNLDQVKTGSAWYYEAYQCEISADMRGAYALAQERAQDESLGLWASPAIAPWVHRNGVEPIIPSCTTTTPSWPAVTPPSAPSTPSPPTTPPSTPPSTTPPSTPSTPSSCAPIWVNGYYRTNGVFVRGHWRKPPGCA